MKEFDYSLDYNNIKFRKNDKRYRIGRGEQGVLLVRPYKDILVKLWEFKTFEKAKKSAVKIYEKFLSYKRNGDFVGMDMSRKFLEMGFTRSRRYANHSSGTKYDKERNIIPQDKNSENSEKAKSAEIFKKYRDLVFHDEEYQKMRKEWRKKE
jgi:hypothetical protein